MSARLFTPQFKQELVSIYREAILSNTPLQDLDDKIKGYRERMLTTGIFEDRTRVDFVKKEKAKIPMIMRLGALLVPVVFLSVGLFLVGNAVIPLTSYYVRSLPTLLAGSLATPIPPEDVLEITPVVVAQAQGDGTSESASFSSPKAVGGPVMLDTQLDYTNLANWFAPGFTPVLEHGSAAQSQTSVYTIDIPKLNIENAEVKIGGTNLDESLIQYPGTADPGQLGSPVIFGHSVLRQFYNPSLKNPRRYNSIFSTIMTLKPGDEISVTWGNVEYKYLVRSKTEVKPEDVHILLQNYDSRQLKLVTCTPEGTYLRRGIITAELVSS